MKAAPGTDVQIFGQLFFGDLARAVRAFQRGRRRRSALKRDIRFFKKRFFEQAEAPFGFGTNENTEPSEKAGRFKATLVFGGAGRSAESVHSEKNLQTQYKHAA
jgi:hypothetical protein